MHSTCLPLHSLDTSRTAGPLSCLVQSCVGKIVLRFFIKALRNVTQCYESNCLYSWKILSLLTETAPKVDFFFGGGPYAGCGFWYHFYSKASVAGH